MRFVLLVALTTTVLATGSALAADKKPADADKKVCRRYGATGSIIGGKSECHTLAEWAQIDRANENDNDRRLRQPAASNPAIRGS